MSEEHYQTVEDKFIFTVKRRLLYTENDTWVKLENRCLRVGLTDFFQRRVGDIIYIEFPKVGIKINRSEEIAQLESIKATSSITSPLAGTLVEVNQSLTNTPEMINEDPYGRGWLVLIHPSNLKTTLDQLLTAERYFELMKMKLENEMKRSKKENK
jgi:glycine cleavage system H protein